MTDKEKEAHQAAISTGFYPRDDIAQHALIGLLAFQGGAGLDANPRKNARLAYVYADEMLIEKGNRLIQKKG